MICGVILAGGASRRMGCPKLEMKLGGKPLLLWTVDAALASTLDQVFCVIRPDLNERLVAELKERRVVVIVNHGADLGQSSSLQMGLSHLPSACRAALFLLGDQPFVSSGLIDRILQAYREASSILVAPIFEGEVRNPVLFDRCLFPELRAVTGDEGGRKVIQRHASEMNGVAVDDPSHVRDIDTPEDFEDLKRFLESQT